MTKIMAASSKYKFMCSAPGMVLMALILLLMSIILGKLFGASYFAMATLTLIFLFLLIIYLVMHLFEKKLMKKIQKCFTEPDDQP
jgi:hypothetical protein